MRKLYTEPSIGAPYQNSVHVATRFQRRRFFRNQPIRNKNCLWWPCLLTDQDKMSNLYKVYRCSIPNFGTYLAKWFKRRRFLEIDQSETRIPCGDHVCKRIRMKWATFIEPSIDASYQVSVHLAKQFQRKFFFRNQPIRIKNGLWWPCLLTDRDKIAIFIEDLP